MTRIACPVGENGKNQRPDVIAIQTALNCIIKRNLLTPLTPLKEDGIAGKNTKAAIRLFQQVSLRPFIPDGRIDPGGKTLAKLNSIISAPKQDFSSSNVSKIDFMRVSSPLLSGLINQQDRGNFNPPMKGTVSNNVDFRSLTKDDFVRKVFDAAQKEALISGVPAAVTAAQAILETGYGRAVPTDINTKRYSYNLFGIKGVGTVGSVDIYTHEVINGKRVRIIDKFQAYNSFSESIAGRTAFLKKNMRYKFLFNSKDPKAWAEGLQKAGYATDPNYAQNHNINYGIVETNMMLRIFLTLFFSVSCSSCEAETVSPKAIDSFVISVLSFSESISTGDIKKFKESTNSENIHLVRKFTSGNLGGRGKELNRIFPLSSINKEMEFSIEGQTPFGLKILFPGGPIREFKKLPQYPLAVEVCDLAFDRWVEPLKSAIAPFPESVEGTPIILAASTKCWVYAEAQVIDGVLVGGFAVFTHSSGKPSLVSVIELL